MAILTGDLEVDGCQNLHQLIGGKHPIILLGIQQSFFGDCVKQL